MILREAEEKQGIGFAMILVSFSFFTKLKSYAAREARGV
jgi:hypothetical protein